MNKKNTGQKIGYISLASVFSAIVVVFVHTNTISGFYTSDVKSSLFLSGTFLNALYSFAVPIFFMISGVTLMNYPERYDTRTFFRKRLLRTFIPFLFWSIFGLVFRVYYLHNFSFEKCNFGCLLNELLDGKIIEMYWFFIPLFMIYLVMPLLAAIPKNKRKKLFSYAVFMMFILNSVTVFILTLFNKNLPNINNYRFLFTGSGYLIFPLLGYLVHNFKIKKNFRILIYIFGLLMLILRIFGTWFISNETGVLDYTFDGYLGVPCIIYSAAVFVFFRYAGDFIMKSKIVSKVVKWLNNETLGIYLIHHYIMVVLIHEISWITGKTLAFRLLMPLLIVPLSALITKFIKNVKIV